jgi:type VI secretion system protein ImpA
LGQLAEDSPCGEDLEYDPEFGELERACQGRAEQQYGDTIIPAEGPDWRDVKQRALQLLERTKDLRVAVTLSQALLATDGLPAFGEALALIRGYVERYWDDFHPRLDPDDNNDPTMRVNTLVSLCDAESSLRSIERAPLVSSPQLGRFGLFEQAIAEGEIPAPDDMDSPPDTARIDAAFLDAPLEELQATRAALEDAIEHVQQIEKQVTERVGVAQAASLEPLLKKLREAEKILAMQLGRRGVQDEAEGEADEAAAEGAASGSAQALSIEGEVRSRQDVIRLLDKICEYYERYEPSSPLPLLLRRAQRLATMSFLDILRELTPGGVAQAESLGGLDGNQDQAGGG